MDTPLGAGPSHSWIRQMERILHFGGAMAEDDVFNPSAQWSSAESVMTIANEDTGVETWQEECFVRISKMQNARPGLPFRALLKKM